MQWEAHTCSLHSIQVMSFIFSQAVYIRPCQMLSQKVEFSGGTFLHVCAIKGVFVKPPLLPCGSVLAQCWLSAGSVLAQCWLSAASVCVTAVGHW